MELIIDGARYSTPSALPPLVADATVPPRGNQEHTNEG